MECVESWAVNNGRLLSDKESFVILERVNDDGTRVAETDLKGRMTILLPEVLES